MFVLRACALQAVSVPWERVRMVHDRVRSWVVRRAGHSTVHVLHTELGMSHRTRAPYFPIERTEVVSGLHPSSQALPVNEMCAHQVSPESTDLIHPAG